MRQVGILAAAGLYALDHHVERLADDHDHARLIAQIVSAERPGVVAPVETNIVVLDLRGGPTAAEVAQAAREQGVLISVLGPATARLVTHHDVDAEGARRAGEVLAGILSERSRAVSTWVSELTEEG